MPWRRPRKTEQRQEPPRISQEERLQSASDAEEERDTVELAAVDGASIVEAATGEPELMEDAPSIAIGADHLEAALVAPADRGSLPSMA